MKKPQFLKFSYSYFFNYEHIKMLDKSLDEQLKKWKN